ncbi:hypothetical protein [Sphingomonas panaciterrae]|uniref:hypothetical protein n=1 Tax=Sphingomonas panaciterrae TaxID=1462999 RepID=UPI002FF246B1
MATREELEADKAALRAARLSLLSGQSVREYWRDGRRVVYRDMTAADIKDAIDDIDSDLAALAVDAGTSRPRFHALSVRFNGR